MEALSVSYSLAPFILWSNLSLYSMQNPPAHTQGTPSPGPPIQPSLHWRQPSHRPKIQGPPLEGQSFPCCCLHPPWNPAPLHNKCVNVRTWPPWSEAKSPKPNLKATSALLGQPCSASGQISKLCWLVPLKALETQFCFSIGFIWEVENLWAWLRLSGHLKAMSHMDGNNKLLMNNS